MINLDKNQTMVNEQPQTVPADTTAKLPKRNVEATTQVPVHPAPDKPTAVTTRSALLLPAKEIEDLRSRWIETQAGFVDEPRKSVEQADALVAGVMKRLAETFANERSKLEEQWSRGDNVSTEELRVALQHYRTFFDKLLAL